MVYRYLKRAVTDLCIGEKERETYPEMHKPSLANVFVPASTCVLSKRLSAIKRCSCGIQALDGTQCIIKSETRCRENVCVGTNSQPIYL